MGSATRSLYRAASWLAQWSCNIALRAALAALTRWRVEGRREHVPRTGPFIVAVNHVSLADPPVLAAALHRRVIFMAKQEIFRWPLIGAAIRLYGAFGVRRFEADLSALRRSRAVLREGKALGMFPEGTRSRGRGLGQPYPGAAIVALSADALIVPAAIWGTERLLGRRLLLVPFTRPRVTVRFGAPFRLPRAARVTAEDARRGAEEIMRRIAVLLPPERLGEYGRALQAGESPIAEEPA